MIVASLTERLRELGVRLWMEGGALRYAAPPGVLTPDLLAEMRACKQELIEMIRAADVRQAIPAQGPGGAGVLSYAQQRMWFVCQLLGESGAYNVPWVLELRGTLREEALERALAEIVRRHAVLRSRFELCGGELRVRGEDSPEFALGRVDLRGASEAELNRRLNREAGAPFDLASGPLFRATLFRVHPDAWVLLLAMHHIVADGWSTAVLNRELAALYAAFCEGRASPLPALGIQYSDFAAWQREWLAGAELERQTAYWRRQLEGLEPLRLEGRARTHTPGTHRAGQVHRRLGAELRTALEGLNQAAGTTLFMSLLACFAALLYRYTGREDIAVGTPIANRTRAEIEPLIGLFVNSLVLRVAVAAEDRFADLLERVRAAALGAYEHQDLPFEKLVEELHPERELSRNPLFEVMFALQNAPMWTIDLPGLAIAPRPVDPPAARLELELHAWEQDGALNLLAVYSEEVFAREWIEAMLGHFERVARQAAADPARRIGDLELLGGEERQRVLVDWNRTTAAAPPLARIDAWIWAAARRWPERIAVRAGSQARTYKQIIARATALAAHLVARGVEAEEQVAIAVGRGVELPAVMLGVFAAGAAYVPLDLRYPRARLEFMLRDSGARFLLVDPQEPAPEFNGVQPISIADLPEPPADAPLWPAPQRCTPHSLAYIIYTSGSTGQPKGVAVEHAGVTALAAWTGEVFSPRELAGLVASTSLCFDVAVFELLTPLAHGGQVRIVPDALQLDAAETLHAKSNLDPDPDGPWMLSTVPSAAWELARSHRIPPWLRTMVLAGEVLSPALVAELRRHGVRRIVNAYGPTEDTVFSTWAEIDPRQEASVPIGRPIPFSRAYVLDARMQPQPAGVAGELWLGGAGVARGYFNRPELTAQRFRGDPFAALHSSPAPELDAQPPRLYRSGDLARWRSDGQIEYLGRLDQQIKLRGFRIEPAEIELTLRAHPAVRDCAVALHNGALAAWIVPAANGSSSGLNEQTLRAHVAETLPRWMVPSALVFLPELPRHPNGKLAHARLPAPESTSSHRIADQPASPEEQRIAAILSETIGNGPMQPDDNFFEAGGHSLLALRVAARIREELGCDLPLAAIFEYPTARTLAARLDRAAESDDPTLAVLRSRGLREPLFLATPVMSVAYPYLGLARALAPDRPCYALQPRGWTGTGAPFDTIEQLAAWYIRSMRKMQPRGPYHLAGWSFGGLAIFEVARQLHAMDETVATLVILDTPAPTVGFRPPLLAALRFGLVTIPLGALVYAREYLYLAGARPSRSGKGALSSLLRRVAGLRPLARLLQTASLKAMNPNGGGALLLEQPDLGPMMRVASANLMAGTRYRPPAEPPLPQLTLVRTDGLLRAGGDPTLGWRQLAQSVTVRAVAGDHMNLLQAPYVQAVAAALDEALAASDGAAARNAAMHPAEQEAIS